MSGSISDAAYEDDAALEELASDNAIVMSDPDITMEEIEAVTRALGSTCLSSGAVVREFEEAFAAWVGRRYAVAVPSGAIGLFLTLRAYGLRPGDEVVMPGFAFRETCQAVAVAGLKPAIADIDYWSGTLSPDKAAKAITENTRAIIASNTNGHPAAWTALRELAQARNLILIEDSSEAIGSTYKDQLVGSFGDCAIFDFAQPSALTCGEGGMVVTDEIDIAVALRRMRSHSIADRVSLVVGSTPDARAVMSDMTAALGLAQLRRIDEILERRKAIEEIYSLHMQSFEGIKPPYIAPDVTRVCWYLYVVHLGTRFTRSARDQIIDDLRVEEIEAAAYALPLHLQRCYFGLGYRRGDLFVTEKVADRAVALPFHTHLSADEIEFIVQTLKDSSVNVGAGAAIY